MVFQSTGQTNPWKQPLLYKVGKLTICPPQSDAEQGSANSSGMSTLEVWIFEYIIIYIINDRLISYCSSDIIVYKRINICVVYTTLVVQRDEVLQVSS